MKLRKKVEIKIFLSFFIIYSFFAQWNDIWDFNSSFSLLKAIVEENRIEIDTYHITTEVKSYYKGHYYTSIAPGISFLMASFYALYKGLITDECVHKFLAVVFSNCLYGALSCLLIYKILNFFTKNKKYKLLTTLSYGLSTSIFPYSLGFYTYVPAIFYILLSFYLFLKEKSEKSQYKKSYKSLFLSGIFMGFAEVIYPVCIFVIFPIFLYAFIVDKKTLLFLILGVIIGYLPLISYNYVIFNSFIFRPDELSKYRVGEAVKCLFPFTNCLKILPRVLFYPWNGLFFYYPILFLSFIGILFMIKKRRIEGYIILFLFLITWVFWASCHSHWWGDFSFGPRRFLLTVPFIILGLPYTLEKFNFKIFLLTFIFSSFNNLLGLQGWWLSLDTLPNIDKVYVEKIENFQVLGNPLLDYYFPLFKINGPRSILLENLLIDKKVCIETRSYNIEPPRLIMKKSEVYLFSLPKIGIIILKLPWFALFVVTLLLLLIWKREIFRKNKINDWILVLVLSTIFFALFIRVRNITYGDNWCNPQWNENNKRLDEGRWIGQNATLYLFSKENINKTLRLVVESFKDNQTLEIYLNREFINNYTIGRIEEISQPIELKEGVNELTIKTCGEFINSWKINVSCDIKFVSFKISKIEINSS
jgi:hypothetical protein